MNESRSCKCKLDFSLLYGLCFRIVTLENLQSDPDPVSADKEQGWCQLEWEWGPPRARFTCCNVGAVVWNQVKNVVIVNEAGIADVENPGASLRLPSMNRCSSRPLIQPVVHSPASSMCALQQGILKGSVPHRIAWENQVPGETMISPATKLYSFARPGQRPVDSCHF